MPTTMAAAPYLLFHLRVIRLAADGQRYEYSIDPSLRVVVNSSEEFVIRIMNISDTPTRVGVYLDGNGHHFSQIISVGAGRLSAHNQYGWVPLAGSQTMNGTAGPAGRLTHGQFNAYLDAHSFVEVHGHITWQNVGTDPIPSIIAEIAGEKGYDAPPPGPGVAIPPAPPAPPAPAGPPAPAAIPGSPVPGP